MREINIVLVRPAPKGFDASVTALVTFEYHSHQIDGPIVINRWVKGKDGEEGRLYEQLRIAPTSAPMLVRVTDAQICKKTKGPYLLTNNVEIPDDVRRAVVDRGLEALKAEVAGT